MTLSIAMLRAQNAPVLPIPALERERGEKARKEKYAMSLIALEIKKIHLEIVCKFIIFTIIV